MKLLNILILSLPLFSLSVFVQGLAKATEIPSAPKFEDFPATKQFSGSPKMPDFGGRDKDYSTFRTRITEATKEGPNFAGKYRVIEIGCGTGCKSVVLVDLSTGQVQNFPLGGEGNPNLQIFNKTESNLLVTTWNDGYGENSPCLGQFFVMKEKLESLKKLNMLPKQCVNWPWLVSEEKTLGTTKQAK